MRLDARRIRGWNRCVKVKLVPGVESSRSLQAASCSNSESCASPARFCANPKLMRTGKRSPRPPNVSARCGIWVLSWFPPETSWSAACGSDLMSARDDAGVGCGETWAPS